ncbi:MAG: tRNA (guanosine(46)-N7)-methyltransferase TrmB [Treponema sp.]|nr:tRNA (guanosine(46)-N7)-methyltransferase TrmB [Treponema sp.]
MSVPRQVKSYVLRAGRMSDAQRRSYETLLPLYGIPVGDEPLRFESIFGGAAAVIVEIGFGMGLATAEIAEKNPGLNYIGIEVHRPGIGRLLWEIEKRGLKNIRIIEGDAMEIVKKMLGENSVFGFHLFFPDPWPKKRHHKRRLVTRPFTDLIASRLLPGGYVYMATDWVDYSQWALKELEETPGLKNKYGGFAPKQDWRPRTKFEAKGLDKNHEIRELCFTRI